MQAQQLSEVDPLLHKLVQRVKAKQVPQFPQPPDGQALRVWQVGHSDGGLTKDDQSNSASP